MHTIPFLTAQASDSVIDFKSSSSQSEYTVSADPRPAVLFALAAHGHAGCDGIVKVKAVTRLSNSVDVVALEQYVQRLLPAFWRGRLALEGKMLDL